MARKTTALFTMRPNRSRRKKMMITITFRNGFVLRMHASLCLISSGGCFTKVSHNLKRGYISSGKCYILDFCFKMCLTPLWISWSLGRYMQWQNNLLCPQLASWQICSFGVHGSIELGVFVLSNGLSSVHLRHWFRKNINHVFLKRIECRNCVHLQSAVQYVLIETLL